MMSSFSWVVPIALALSGATPMTAPSTRLAAAESSFSCAKVGDGTEAVICANPALAAADRTMAQLYDVDRVSAFNVGPSNELAAQRRALAAIHKCSPAPANRTVVSCLQANYDDRVDELAIAALMRAPKLALPVLRRTDPAFAPILEAVQIWASEPKNVDWSSPDLADKRARILELLAPTMTELLTKQDQSYGREILTNPSGGGVAVKRVEDIFISERHFAAFLNVIGPFLDDSRPHDARALPCAAIVAHPALLAATSSLFGSTMDNFVLRNDCGETLPPTPALTALNARLSKLWPACEGTIRFAAYRTYETSIDAARLGTSPRDRGAIHHRRGITASDVAAVRNELAVYYARYLGRSPAVARTMAQAAVADVMETADSCGD